MPRTTKGQPRLALTMGDPAGVGPELVLRLLSESGESDVAHATVVGDKTALRYWADRMSLPMPEDVVDTETRSGDIEPGHPTPEGALASLDSIKVAVRLCALGEVDAMVTAPVCKAAIADAGHDFTGHTEFLATLTNTRDYLMTFVDGPRRVALATTHLPLSEVPAALTGKLIEQKLRVLNRGLTEWFGVEGPRIAVAGLNPHAGEEGRFGDEEERVIAPAIARVREAGMEVEGPFPADTVFVGLGGDEGPGAGYDAVLAMYHDQGTIAAKLWGFDACVNVTLGLPIIRTSVDHGTAFALAGRGTASTGSLVAAVRLAADIAGRVSESA
jgi:4-hydroxythreonine-4-phosphate dehydrogenase